jgi:hypothetical protein
VAKLRLEMVKLIGGGTVASFHLGMSGLSVRVVRPCTIDV